MYTDQLYTGQREITGLGIYHYQARFYSPRLGRFLSADTIIPVFENPQSWNRYAYVNNAPTRFTDPSGHNPECGPDGMFCDSSGMVIKSNKQLYKKLVSEGFFLSIPKIQDLEWDVSKGGPLSHLEGALNQYEIIREELFTRYGFKYVDIAGKIDDKAFMAIIISVEFGKYEGKNIFGEALEALSNQYHSESSYIHCNGDCSLTDQIGFGA